MIRHGETDWSLTGKHTGRSDIPLTTRGQEQAKTLAVPLAQLQLDDPVVLSSPRIRARTTAALAGLTIDEIDDRLCEWDYGEYEGLTTPQIREREPGWTIFGRGAAGGETVAQMTARVDSVVTDLVDRSSDRDVVVFSHGHLSRSLIARWLRAPIELGAGLAMLTASAAVLGFDREHPQLRSLGLTGYDSATYAGR